MATLHALLRKIARKNRGITDDVKNAPIVADQTLPFTATPKWGVCFIVYDGEELLEASIDSIRADVDWIGVCWSHFSYYGDGGSPVLPLLINKLKSSGKIEVASQFEPEVYADPSQRATVRQSLEIAKRNHALDLAKCAGVTHFMTMDTDEFYDPLRFAKPKIQLSIAE